MAITPGWTAEEIRELVYEYERQPYGTKGGWLKERGVSGDRFRRWRAAVFDGDLDKGLIPREGGVMTPAQQRRRAAKTQLAKDAEMERLRARVAELEAANDALGKAIGLLHKLNEHEPDASPTKTPPPTS